MKNKKTVVRIVAIILAIAIIAGVAIVITYNKNVNLAEKEKNEEEQTQELVLEDNEYMHVEYDASGDKVPVPKGFVGSSATGENEIDSGYVIYAGEEEVTDSNVAEAQKTRNQYVWVPVPDPSKFYGTDANGKRWGKIYNFTTSTSSDITFDEVTGTYANNWSETDGIMNITKKENASREPDVVTGQYFLVEHDVDSNLRQLSIGTETTHEFLMELEKNFCNMLDSVEKYGGFYIGRYETGNLNQGVAVVQKGNTDIDAQSWYTMYKKCKTLNNNNINVETGMIWRNQFDRTLMWLMECNAQNPETGKSKEEVIGDSTSWANYCDAEFTYINSNGVAVKKPSGKIDESIIIPTGSTEYTKANNIYDLAGNMLESTMGITTDYSRDHRDRRGGSWYYKDGNSAVSSGEYDSGATGCRATLYIK